MKKAALLFASGTEEIEALTPVDILRRAGAHVDVIGVGTNEPVGSHGIRIKTDMTLESADLLSYDMIIIPGGMPGTANIEETGIASLLEKADAKGIFIAAICAAPMILGKAGLLSGREAICYPGFEKYLVGAKLADKKVVRSGNIITAKGMGVALEFALELISVLYGKEKADEMASSVMAK
ncbi:MAG: DJ-1 family glyoxalase III [Eubacteriales bacterium]